jgi:membrane-associated protease RseP (regulator of RpoE activity)
MLSSLSAIIAVLALSAGEEPPAGGTPAPRPQLVRLPSADKSPLFRGGLPARAGEATPAPKRRFFGIGVGFQRSGTVQGIVLDQIVPASPAERAGLTAGTVITEINGESTVGRSGDDCTRMVRDGGSTVVIKFNDPITLKPRTRTLEKEWFPLPNLTGP